MRRTLLAAAVFVFAASCGTLVHHDLTLTFDERGERVEVAAATLIPTTEQSFWLAGTNGACASRTRIPSRIASCWIVPAAS